MSSYKVTVKRDCRELGYIKGMSVTVPMFADEVPLRGTGREKVRRMFMDNSALTSNSSKHGRPHIRECLIYSGFNQ